MVDGGRSWPDEGRKVDGFLLLHFSDGPLLGDLSVTSCSSIGRSRFVFVLGIVGSPVEVLVCQAAA